MEERLHRTRGVVTEKIIDANDQQRDCTVIDSLGKKVSHRGISVNDFGQPVLIGDDVIVDGKVQETVFTTLDYDNLNQLKVCTLAANTPDTAVYRYVYDSSGRKIQDVKPSGLSIHSTYDAKGRLTRLSSSDGNEIMSAGQPIPDPGKIPGGLRWDVPGTFRGRNGSWELVVNPENKIIYHFNFK